jgi:tripartite-type tricarboxylate transporter receptor subunit TctC
MNLSLTRRHLIHLAGAASLTSAISALAQGQVARMYVGFPPGGTLDVLARLLAPLFAKGGATIIVENRPGASAQLAAVAVHQAPPDGLSLLVTPTSVMTLTSQLFRKPLLDPLRDLAPIGSVCEHPFAFAVTGNSPIRTIAEFIAWAKANPKDASYASPGAGTSPHFLGLMLAKASGAQLTHIAYRGTAPGLQDLMGGQIASTMNALPAMIDLHKAGRIRILATTGSKRLASLPEVPTFTELRIPGLEYSESFGVFAHGATSAATISRLEAALQQAVASPEMAQAAKKMELELKGSTSAAYKQLVEEDFRRWAGIAKESGFHLDT